MTKITILALDATRSGGAGVYTGQLAIQLAEQGHQITVVCHDASEEVRNGCAIKKIARPKKHWPLGAWRISAVLQLFEYWQALKSLQLGQTDIVIGSAQPMVVIYFMLFPRSRLIYIPHSMIAPIELASYSYAGWLQRWSMITVYRLMERFCLKKATATIRFTQSAANALIHYYGKPVGNKILVMPMPIDMPTHIPEKIAHTEIRLLSVGRLIASKNLGFLLHSLSALPQSGWHLDIVGDGPDRAMLSELAQSLGLAKLVKFHGHQENVTDHYVNADLFVFPSLLESHAIVIVEAMSNALPVLAFQSDGQRYINVNHELIEDGQTGLLATSEEQFSALLQQACLGKIPLRELGLAARQAVIDKNAWQQHGRAMAELIESVRETQHQINF